MNTHLIKHYLLSYDGYILNFVNTDDNTIYYCTDNADREIVNKMLNIFSILYPSTTIISNKFGYNCTKINIDNKFDIYIYTILLSDLKIPELNFDCNQIMIDKYAVRCNFNHVRYPYNGIQILKPIKAYDIIYSRIAYKKFAASNDYIYNILNLAYDNGDEYLLMDLSPDYYYSTILYAAKLVEAGWIMLDYIVLTRSWRLIYRNDAYYIIYKNNEYELLAVLSKLLTV